MLYKSCMSDLHPGNHLLDFVAKVELPPGVLFKLGVRARATVEVLHNVAVDRTIGLCGDTYGIQCVGCIWRMVYVETWRMVGSS